MRVILWGISFFLLGSAAGWSADRPAEAMNQLTEGNRRFVSGQTVHKNLSAEALEGLRVEQAPIAVIVGCSDSRVPPEVIFDQGLGRLFVVRVAGNVIGPVELDSIRFAVEKLKAPLIMVLGHEDCAAIKDALYSGKAKDSVLPHIYPLIAPALQRCHQKEGDPVMNAVWCNVLEGVRHLQEEGSLKSLIGLKELEVVGGYYDFDHGTVQIIPTGTSPF